MLQLMIELALSAGILLGLLLLLLIIYRTNAGVMFLAACAGLVLLGSMDPTVVTAAGSVISSSSEAYIRVGIVLVPIIFAALMFKHTTHGSQLVLHILICILTTTTLLLILPEQTGLPWLLTASQQQIWMDVNEFLTIIVAISIALSLLAVMLRGNHSKKGKHR